MTNKRIGFACKLSELSAGGVVSAIESCNTKTTTISWLGRQTKQVAEDKLLALMQHNVQSVFNLVSAVSKMPEIKRMVRISSDVLPAYTHDSWRYFYQSQENKNYLAREFAKIGELARSTGVRLSFHPGQFCCIVSNNPGIVERSIEELEYHATMAEWMGYGERPLDFKINIHLSGKLGISGFMQAYEKMSRVLQSSLTLENDEYQAGLDVLLPLAPYVGIVLDIHHHFINTGEYISPDDARLQEVRDSWQGHRPVIHYSQSGWVHLENHTNSMPTLATLLESTNRSKLRGHSEFYNHAALNEWALQFLDWADIMSESKSKNLGVDQILAQYKQN
ncbi:Uve UV damage repair endonuclease [uncultured Caudovirales phage]|uniref:Uve UV damage repair endonuclease n=1 Tax=uncultured Caudovirales phage TaxID=2100421 RepID=A0A6J5L636_9CAUD|nr:Uve UV damage repair endonuclease [uncultured Caudovirales phage]